MDEVTTKDLYNLMKTKTDEIQKQNTDIKEELKQEIRTIKAEISKELETVKEDTTKLTEENKLIKDRLLKVERKLKKYNLVFYGLEEGDDEVEGIERLLEIINTKIQIDCRYTDIRDIYRLGKQKKEESKSQSRPILVEFISYKQKTDILKNARRLKGTGIYVANDNTPEDYQKLKILRFHQKAARENNQEAVIKNNTLYINGEPILYENLNQNINENSEEDKQQDQQVEKNPDNIDIEFPGFSNAAPIDSDENEQSKKRKLKQAPEKENPTKRITRPKIK